MYQVFGDNDNPVELNSIIDVESVWLGFNIFWMGVVDPKLKMTYLLKAVKDIGHVTLITSPISN